MPESPAAVRRCDDSPVIPFVADATTAAGFDRDRLSQANMYIYTMNRRKLQIDGIESVNIRAVGRSLAVVSSAGCALDSTKDDGTGDPI